MKNNKKRTQKMIKFFMKSTENFQKNSPAAPIDHYGEISKFA